MTMAMAITKPKKVNARQAMVLAMAVTKPTEIHARQAMALAPCGACAMAMCVQILGKGLPRGPAKPKVLAKGGARLTHIPKQEQAAPVTTACRNFYDILLISDDVISDGNMYTFRLQPTGEVSPQFIHPHLGAHEARELAEFF